MTDDRIILLGTMYGQHSRWGVYDPKGISPTLMAAMGVGGGHIPMIPDNSHK